MKLLILSLFITPLLFSTPTETEMELHTIFNAKLAEPLKLSPDKNKEFIKILNHYAQEMLNQEDKLTDNLTKIRTELKKRKNADTNALRSLNNDRQKIIMTLSQMEQKKIMAIQKILNTKQLSSYFILKEKLLNKFKKAINVNALTD